MLPFIFAKFGGLGKLLTKINSMTEEVDEITNYEKYCPSYNMWFKFNNF